jgi:hypothetical protein
VSCSDTCRWTRIFGLFLLSSGVTSFAAQFAYLMVPIVFFEQQAVLRKTSTASQANSATSNHRGVDLISDALPFGRLWYQDASAAVDYAKHSSRSHDAVFTMKPET